MKIIRELSDYIEEEICDSEKYIKQALKYKKEMPWLADTFYKLSNEELNHMQMLHNSVVKIINDYKTSGEEVPPAMQAVYDYLHEKFIDETKEVKILQQMYVE